MQGTEVNLQRWQADLTNPVAAFLADGVGDGDLNAQTGVGVSACSVCGIAYEIRAGKAQALFQLHLGQRQVLFRQSPSPAVAAFLGFRLHVDHIFRRAQFASFLEDVFDDIVKDGF